MQLISISTGFLRAYQIAVPNYEVPSRKHFQDMLSEAYNKVKKILQDKVESDDPPVVSAELDAWSAHHHGQIMNLLIWVLTYLILIFIYLTQVHGDKPPLHTQLGEGDIYAESCPF